MFDSLRDVAQQEIFNSYRGILRISPNYFEEAEVDDTTDLYNSSNDFYKTGNKTNSPDSSTTKIHLSDSAGDLFDIYFYPKTYRCTLTTVGTVDLVNMVHYYNILRINKKINIKSTLSCNNIIVYDNGLQLKYPIDSPYDSAYCNMTDKLGIGTNFTDDSIEEAFSNPKLATKLTNYKQVIVDDQLVYRKSTTGTKIPEVYRHDYILGHCKGGTYSNKGNRETQLSFISLDKMIWEKLTAALNGIGNNRHYQGRYDQLGKDKNESIKSKLFGTATADVKNTAPILGIPVQSGIVMYSSMPIQRYLFHLKTLDKTTDPANTYVYNLLTEYALCDGRILKNSTNGSTDYENISKESKNWKDYNTASTDLSVYNAIHKSTLDVGSTANQLKTPALFETDQISPRYIRGLNWERGSFGENAVQMSKIPPDMSDAEDDLADDLANNAKNIYEVGPYLANGDYRLRRAVRHQHHCLVNQNAVPKITVDGTSTSCDDKLWEDTNWAGPADSITPIFGSETEYKDDNNKPSTYKGTYILRTKTGFDIERESQDIPIASAGGSRSTICKVGYAWKGASCIKLPFGGRVCHNHKDHINRGVYAPGYFAFRRNRTPSDPWRTISSSSRHFNVYGVAKGSDPTIPSAYSTYKMNNGDSIKLDETLPYPTTFNFLPLIKI